MATKSTAVELKDKETTFYDPETKFKVVRDQVAELGPKKGKLTIAAIASKGLIEVNASPRPATGQRVDDAEPAKTRASAKSDDKKTADDKK